MYCASSPAPSSVADFHLCSQGRPSTYRPGSWVMPRRCSGKPCRLAMGGLYPAEIGAESAGPDQAGDPGRPQVQLASGKAPRLEGWRCRPVIGGGLGKAELAGVTVDSPPDAGGEGVGRGQAGGQVVGDSDLTFTQPEDAAVEDHPGRGQRADVEVAAASGTADLREAGQPRGRGGQGVHGAFQQAHLDQPAGDVAAAVAPRYPAAAAGAEEHPAPGPDEVIGDLHA